MRCRIGLLRVQFEIRITFSMMDKVFVVSQGPFWKLPHEFMGADLGDYPTALAGKLDTLPTVTVWNLTFIGVPRATTWGMW